MLNINEKEIMDTIQVDVITLVKEVVIEDNKIYIRTVTDDSESTINMSVIIPLTEKNNNVYQGNFNVVGILNGKEILEKISKMTNTTFNLISTLGTTVIS